ncbi:MAG: hypothetical protein Q7S95_02360 [bacterium]|nr:hypothetical protein [bacterium]
MTKRAEVAQPVIVARMGEVVEVPAAAATTLGMAIENAGYRTANVTDVRVNNLRVTDMETVINPGDQVTLLGKIAGA